MTKTKHFAWLCIASLGGVLVMVGLFYAILHHPPLVMIAAGIIFWITPLHKAVNRWWWPHAAFGAYAASCFFLIYGIDVIELILLRGYDSFDHFYEKGISPANAEAISPAEAEAIAQTIDIAAYILVLFASSKKHRKFL